MEVLINGHNYIMINHDRWVLYQCGSTADHKPDTNDTARGMIQRKRVVEHCKYIVTDHNDSWWRWRWYGDYLEAAELMYTKPKQKKYDQTLLFCWWWVSTVCFPRKMTHNQLCKFQLVLMQISNFEKKSVQPNWTCVQLGILCGFVISHFDFLQYMSTFTLNLIPLNFLSAIQHKSPSNWVALWRSCVEKCFTQKMSQQFLSLSLLPRQ